MDGIASTRAEADAELQRLREQRGIQGQELRDSALVSSLDQALDIYASGVAPRLHLSLYEKDGQKCLRTDCNEVGFTFKQLDALTRVGQSTKKSTAGGQKGYIGEKGIGFKSVFKVADVIHIASGFYEFKLDRNKPIGMILPIFSRFPSADRIADQTQFLLELKYNDDYKEIWRDLKDVEPQLLLFLRKLRELHVSTDGGVTTSEVVVAFAVKDQITPIATTQMAFAFLPIDNFGFQFLIHADFLLVASRESLEYKCPWNLALRDGIRDALVEAINRFVVLPENEDGKGLCYTWPKYLSRHPGSSVFWNTLHQNILDALRHEAILQSRDEDAPFQKPETLRYVPEDYRFEDGTLFDLPSINASHLSFAYDSVRENLSLIGVSTLTVGELCDEFDEWIDEVGVAGIEEQSTQWHRKVSSLLCDWTLSKEKLRKFPIIPLRDGSWVNAEEKHLYLAAKDGDEHVPTGVDISIVDQDASRDPVRRKFFEFLGIKEYSPRQVCDLIIELHEDLSEDSTGRASRELVADVAYLFKHRSQLEKDEVPEILFVAMKNGKPLLRRLGRYYMNRTYLVDPTVKPGLIAKYRNTAGNPFIVLSDEYETAICEEGKEATEATAKEFREWFSQLNGSRFATVPALCWLSCLTSEWIFLRRQDVVDLLYVVKFHWEKHNPNLRLLKAVRELQVRCLDGITRALGLLAVPTADLKQNCPHLDFAELPKPTLENWSFLSEFGVITTYGTTARLRELQAISELPVDDVDKEAVHEIYRALSSSMSLDKKEIEWGEILSPCYITDANGVQQNSILQTPSCVRHETEAQVDKSRGLRMDGACSLEASHQAQSPLHLSGKQIDRIQSAPVFPILEQRNGSKEESGIALRSVDDADWYIPDSATLETAFRGKVDMLSLPVKSARMLRGLFEDLGCKDMFLSSAVEETVEPSGTCICDRLREDNLKTRLGYISQLAAEDAEFMQDFSLLRVWSVPSIMVTWCLDDVEVTNDNEVILIEEKEETTDIYFREGFQESDQPAVNFELLEYFISTFAIDVEDTNLVNLLMSAPISRLPGIMEKHDISLPEDSDDDGTDSEEIDSEDDNATAVDRTEEPSNGELNVELSENDKDEGSCGKPLVASSARDSDVESEIFSSFAPTRPHRPQSLRELIPSHQSSTESIIRQASHFRMADSLVATTSIQQYELDGVFRQSLPIRTRSIHDGGGGRSSPGQPTATATSRGSFSDGYNLEFCGNHSSDYQASPGVRDRPVPVYELFERQIDDWTFKSWTSDMRGEAGHPCFKERQRDFSDFTYLDRYGHMKEALREAGVEPNAEWSNNTKFHLEVKATLGHCAEAFFVSQNQFDKMREFDGDPNNTYVLLRVFNLEEGNNPGIKFFRDPWSLYMGGILNFRSEAGYKVY
ncbi:hypothetical protein DL770_008214 [Monosporascus sp. CRB-9-2]|nr:hypothetical protein DL770_008214 [Monosporascus sp. CRB-9-2]